MVDCSAQMGHLPHPLQCSGNTETDRGIKNKETEREEMFRKTILGMTDVTLMAVVLDTRDAHYQIHQYFILG